MTWDVIPKSGEQEEGKMRVTHEMMNAWMLQNVNEIVCIKVKWPKVTLTLETFGVHFLKEI